MPHHTIGFSNLDENNPFATSIRHSLEKIVSHYPDLTLISRDNALNTQVAIQNSREFAEVPVDVAIVFHIDELAGLNVINPLFIKGIPVISIDIPIALTVYLGTNFGYAGTMAGDVLSHWVNEKWDGFIDKMLVMTEQRVLDLVQQRFEYAIETIKQKTRFHPSNLLMVDSGQDPDISGERVKDVLDHWQDCQRIAILCINDKVARGVMAAVREINREGDVIALSYDGTEYAVEEFKRPDSRLIVSPWAPADVYGQQLLELSMRLVNKEIVPRKNYIEPICLTRDNFTMYRG